MTGLGKEVAQQIADVAEAFTRQSGVYDEYEVENENLKRVRNEIYEHFTSLIHKADKILEVNAGTGTDAVVLANRGYRFHATDVAEGMVAEIEKKVQAEGFQGKITTQVLSFTELEKTEGGQYQACFSNIGGLNCIPDLRAFAEQLPHALSPGAIATMVIMPPMCPWEWLEVFRARFKVAFRRWKRGGAVVSPKGIPYRIYYHSPRHIKSAFRGKFRLVKQQSLSLFSPPMDRKQFSRRRPSLYRFLVWLDNLLSSVFPFNQLGDFIVYSFRYQP
ncbi:MAG: class I SAM-dependent methyltransferase [Anaerolineales bacterium]